MTRARPAVQGIWCQALPTLARRLPRHPTHRRVRLYRAPGRPQSRQPAATDRFTFTPQRIGNSRECPGLLTPNRRAPLQVVTSRYRKACIWPASHPAWGSRLSTRRRRFVLSRPAPANPRPVCRGARGAWILQEDFRVGGLDWRPQWASVDSGLSIAARPMTDRAVEVGVRGDVPPMKIMAGCLRGERPATEDRHEAGEIRETRRRRRIRRQVISPQVSPCHASPLLRPEHG